MIVGTQHVFEKASFGEALSEFVVGLSEYVCTSDGQWAIKGFIDAYRNVFTISSDTKIVSKILEIHIFPRLLAFADGIGYRLVLAQHQNYYPDISFVKDDDDSIRFAVDFKTTYRLPDKPHLCNGFTLGSHGAYFRDRTSRKNIQFPYASYAGHFCLGIIYDRIDGTTIDETRSHHIDQLTSISSVARNFEFFVAEKWRIASDLRGSGNTANIGSISHIADLRAGNGVFSKLGEAWFDDYWMNYQSILIPDGKGGSKKINNLADFVCYRGGDQALIVTRKGKME